MASPNELSFLPDDYLERKAQRRTNAICAMLFLVVMVAIGSAFTFTERAMRAVEAEYAAVEREYTEAAKRIELVQQMQEKQKKMATQAELAASLLEKVPRSYLLAEVTNSLPVGVSLIDLIMESKVRSNPAPAARSTFEQKRAPSAPAAKKGADSAPAQQAKVYDVNLKITGIAYTDVQVAQFISALSQSKILKDVNLLISDEYKSRDGSNESQLRKFQIEAMINPDAEVTAADQQRRRSEQTAAIELKEETKR
jgi:Tfp pilus assembly protein PilN